MAKMLIYDACFYGLMDDGTEKFLGRIPDINFILTTDDKITWKEVSENCVIISIDWFFDRTLARIVIDTEKKTAV